jgi:hypothetical protein
LGKWYSIGKKSQKVRSIMDSELEHILRTYSDHEVISEKDSLRNLLTWLRSPAEDLQLDFEYALTESGDAYQYRLFQAFDPCV